MNGHFVISLDFELHWGVFDVRKVEDYKENLLNVSLVVKRLLELSDRYNVKLTFSTVGFLFAENKTELLKYSPKLKPSYTQKEFSPYPLIESIGELENEDPYHYAKSLIKEIIKNGNHEIGTHTFSHYYCHELGQTAEQFEADLKAAVAIAKPLNIDLKSIVFPRNMIDANRATDVPYLKACLKHGITSYRGKEKAFIYNIHTTKPYHGWLLFRLLRILDAYINITGYNTYIIKDNLKKNNLLNLPSSRLLRPYVKSLSFLEPLKTRRIKKAMKHAAKHGELFHLWWHPHNFGTHIDDNFSNLEKVFKTYKTLNETHGFKSETMTDLTTKIQSS